MLSNKDLKPKALDKDLDRIGFVGDAAEAMGRRLTGPGLAVIFLALCAVVAASHVASTDLTNTLFLVSAAVVGGYMALNIGANDVANNVGPAVGARVVSLTTALIIAAVCESAGALLAGGDVVSTISGSILSPGEVSDNRSFMLAMLTAMAASALWINFATLIGAPVSTTHSIIGGVVGAGIALGGFSAINWTTVSTIAASWVVSPVLGGVVAAVLMAFINNRLIYADNKLEAARHWLPLLLGGMATTFAAFLAIKTGDRIAVLPGWLVVCLSLVFGSAVWWVYRRVVSSQVPDLENNPKALRSLFGIPLMLTAGLLSFAHGANDVANAIGPLAAIVQSQSKDFTDLSFWFMGTLNPEVPVWVGAVGAFGISAGLLLFGRRLVMIVGKQITKLNPIRAFCVTSSTAATVLTASGLGLPVSSTHIAVGAVFGVGFYREWHRNRFYSEAGRLKVRKMLRNKEERRRRLLVRRSNLITIIGAWVVTVPFAALLAGLIYTGLEALLF